MVSGDVLKLECGALVVGIPAGGLTPTAEALDKASEGVVSRWIEAGDIHPCVGKVAVFRDFPGCKAERVVFVGLGKGCPPPRPHPDVRVLRSCRYLRPHG